jgi:hypothetical protein
MIEEATFEVGQAVFWVTNTRNYLCERAGHVIAAVPPLEHANNMNFGEIASPNMSVRNDWSYLVRTPINPVIFWLSTLHHLPDDKKNLLEAQKPLTTKRQMPIQAIDRSDRIKIKRCLKKLDMEFTESEKHINNLTGNVRYVFNVQNGIEFLADIEYIKFQ